jgi:hypothetical protein
METRALNSIPFPVEEIEDHDHSAPAHYNNQQLIPSFLKNIKQDDIILIVLIILLLTEGNHCDYLLVGVLVFIFLAEFDGNFLGF